MTDCPEPERWVRAHWEGDVKDDFKSTLHIVALDRGGLLFDVMPQLANMNVRAGCTADWLECTRPERESMPGPQLSL